ncbi:SUKH-4 family immunity protein [Streptomyces sp. S07_1.15]|uniref:SUKH-4 family immunity protein n=1 Tax=Streptomyces sp. S07_1.15 TaxID=2873925 RepID=UPI001D136F6C|nr:SUKH-4 family immunity protein [Streptomyces sp. S07_1.15]MCC3653494.1 SUKH-4 family immunity protein [Streptomyces sp. S07_1.15]
MVTFAQAQERAEEWINGDVPAYQHREVKVREFDLGFVVWAEDREDGPTSDGGRSRLVIARDSGDATLWPALPVGEIIRHYEERYGAAPLDTGDEPAERPQRVDLEATSFLLTPPQWLQDAADQIGIPDRRRDSAAPAPGSGPAAGADTGPGTAAGPGPGGTSGAGSGTVSGAGSGPGAGAAPGAGTGPATHPAPAAAAPSGGTPVAGTAWPEAGSSGASGSPGGTGSAAGNTPGPSTGDGATPAAPGAVPGPAAPPGGTPWAGTDITAGPDDASVDLPATVFAPPLAGEDGDETAGPQQSSRAHDRTELMSGGSQLPRTTVAPAVGEPSTPGGTGTGGAPAPGGTPRAPQAPQAQQAPQAPGTGAPPPPGPPGAPGASGAPGTPPPPPAPGAPGGGAHHAATMLAGPNPGGPATPGAPHPPGPPGTPGAGTPPPPGPPGTPGTPGTPGASGGDPHYQATMLAGPNPAGPAAPGAPHPPGPPGTPGAGAGTPPPPGPPGTPGASGGPGAPGGDPHYQATMLAGPNPAGPAAPGAPHPPGPPGAPGRPPGAQPPPPPPAPGAYGYPQAPAGPPMVGPGYMAVLRYRAQDGSEQQIIRRSAYGTPHPEWQILHELRAQNVPPQQVLELHTELESCDLPGGYCARMVRETFPQVRISHTAPYGRDHATRQQGVRHLIEHQGELHQVADGPARPAPNRVPLPHPGQVPPIPPVPAEGLAHELAQSFGPQGLFRFDQHAVSRQGVPDIVAQTLVWAGLPVDFGPFFWAQAQPGRPVPTLAELAAERGVQPAPDAGSYLVMGSDFGRQLCVQYGTANIVAVPIEAGPGGQPVPPQFVNTGLPEFVRCMAMLGRMWRLRYGLTPEQAGRWTVDFQAQLIALDPACLSSPESWWSVILEQMWDGLL